MNKKIAKWVGLGLALVLYFGGFWIFYGYVPGVFLRDGGLNWPGFLIIAVLSSLFSFIFSGAYKDDPESKK